MIKSNTSKIGLLDNACHSLQRGYEMFNKGRQKKDALALKEAIIWIHHGIELSIKQLLVQSNEYLIFDNIDEAVRKLAHLRRQPSMSNANVLDLFDSSEGVYTVGFGKLVDRAAIMLNLQEISQGAELREKIDALTSYRNKIVHFAVDVAPEEVVILLSELMEPFLILLEKQIKDISFVRECLPLVRAQAESVSAVYRLQHEKAAKRIKKLLEKFDEIEVSGDYFGALGRLNLHKFDLVETPPQDKYFGFDLLGKSATVTWLVDLKVGRLNNTQIDLLINQLDRYQMQFEKAIFWLIILGTDEIDYSSKVYLRNNQIFVSTEIEIKQLENLLKVS